MSSRANAARIRAIVFDFDGLVVDTEGPVFEGWRSLYQSLGQELSEELWADVIGHGAGWFDPFPDLEAAVGGPLDREALHQARRAKELELVASQPVLPGVLDWIARAQELGLGLGVASSSSLRWVNGHLDRLGITAFRCVRGRDSVAEGRTKPAPDLYLSAVSCLGVTPSEAVAIEDSGVGLTAAKSAGLRCVAVPGPLTLRNDFSAADLRLGSLAERTLDEVLAELQAAPAG
ncbi:MAG: HAD-IA family hydrolase [Candidatus Dormibacteraeota bacterium]|nr:HAD-IA family hydrolase [Candidatus Dormibacteraeota bacterium]MBO0743402.1 HAD-IA family hydrolase [Candidatus Dormibacteraeota bacterium]